MFYNVGAWVSVCDVPSVTEISNDVWVFTRSPFCYHRLLSTASSLHSPRVSPRATARIYGLSRATTKQTMAVLLIRAVVGVSGGPEKGQLSQTRLSQLEGHMASAGAGVYVRPEG